MSRPRVAIIDYGMGNLFSVQQACAHAGLDAGISSDADALLHADAAILPGVGAFGDAMANVRSLGLDRAIHAFIGSGRPFLGICLGMQLLMSEGEEFGRHEGLGVFKGKVVRFPARVADNTVIKVPQVGWNRIRKAPGGADWNGSILDRIRDGERVYFVHSFYPCPGDSSAILSMTDYEGVGYCSGMRRDNVTAVQFHPEKSGACGIEIYKSFARSIRSGI